MSNNNDMSLVFALLKSCLGLAGAVLICGCGWWFIATVWSYSPGAWVFRQMFGD